MAITEKYLDTSLGLGADAGTEAAPWMSWTSAAAGLSAGERLLVQDRTLSTFEGTLRLLVTAVLLSTAGCR